MNLKRLLDLGRRQRAHDQEEIVLPGGRRTLWVGTLGGAAWTDLSSPGAEWHLLSDASEPSLPNNVIYDIFQDAQGRIYLSSNKGVALLTPQGTAPDGSPGFTVYAVAKAALERFSSQA